jgi:predicted helicase
VKFIRFAQWRIEQTGYGVLAYISNHGYLDNPTFRGMRQSLMETFDEIYVLDLHDNSKKKERSPDGSQDENVFDIQQGVAIGIFVKNTNGKRDQSTVYHAHLWGERGIKYKNLIANDLSTTQWNTLAPQSPFYLFVPQNIGLREEYERDWKLTEIMPVNALGFQSHRDHFAISFDESSLRARLSDLRDSELPDDQVHEKYEIRDNRDWKLSAARKRLRSDKEWKRSIIRISYRPFDYRFCYFSTVTMDYPRREMLDHVAFKDNLCLNTVRQTRMESWQHAVVSNAPAPAVYVELKDGSSLFPLYLYPIAKESLFDDDEPTETPSGRRPNLAAEFVSDIEARIGLEYVADGKGDLVKTFGPEDVFGYIYAVFHSPTYRSRYGDFLRLDFPRVPLTSNEKLFRKLSSLGDELVTLHLMQMTPSIITRYPVTGDNTVKKVTYSPPSSIEDKGLFFEADGEKREGRIWINSEQYFEGVPPEVWAFHVGGYQVCQKWLKDRKGRKLTYDDLTHYQHIISALAKTISLMTQIDGVIETHNGWPII